MLNLNEAVSSSVTSGADTQRVSISYDVDTTYDPTDFDYGDGVIYSTSTSISSISTNEFIRLYLQCRDFLFDDFDEAYSACVPYMTDTDRSITLLINQCIQDAYVSSLSAHIHMCINSHIMYG